MKQTFNFKQFSISQPNSGMKVTSDAVLFGAYAAHHALSLFKSSDDTHQILDIGCGTGLLSLMLAQQLSESKFKFEIDAIDIDQNSLIDASHNFSQTAWQHAVQLHHESIIEFKPNKKFDVIICNPPFYHNNKQSLSKTKNQAWHLDKNLSPAFLAQKTLALLNNKGIAFYLWPRIEAEQFCAQILKHNDSSIEMTKLSLITNSGNKKDINKSASKRCIVMIKKGVFADEHSTSLIEQDLVVFDAQQQYIEPARSLLRPFYRFID